MAEPITEQNRAEATVSLLRAAAFYRGLVNAVSERDPELMARIMDEGEGDSRWNAAEAGDDAIKSWADFLEIRDI